ncbi:MAG: hypothetical protein ACR2H2_01210 [Solirubrobacteraceae bacterium]
MRCWQSHTKAILVASLSILLVVAGCGGDANDNTRGLSDDELIRRTVVSWYAAVARGDGLKACALMTYAARARDLDAGGGIVLEPSGSVHNAPTTCQQQVEAIGRELVGGGLAAEVNAAAVRGVRVLGDQATVTTEFAQRRQSLVLRRVAGRWLIDGAPK